MKTSTVVVIIIAILIIAGGAWWYTQNNTAAPSTQTTTVGNAGGSDYTPPADTVSTTTASSTSSTTTATAAPKTVTVTFNSSTGFSPKTVNVNAGDTVIFKAASGQMWIGSDAHPSHTEYDGTSRTTHCAPGYTGPAPFDQCSAGATFSFTFAKAGTFEYHNHLAAQNTGTVVVQ
jgi:plastocyanin